MCCVYQFLGSCRVPLLNSPTPSSLIRSPSPPAPRRAPAFRPPSQCLPPPPSPSSASAISAGRAPALSLTHKRNTSVRLTRHHHHEHTFSRMPPFVSSLPVLHPSCVRRARTVPRLPARVRVCVCRCVPAVVRWLTLCGQRSRAPSHTPPSPPWYVGTDGWRAEPRPAAVAVGRGQPRCCRSPPSSMAPMPSPPACCHDPPPSTSASHAHTLPHLVSRPALRLPTRPTHTDSPITHPIWFCRTTRASIPL